MPLEKVERDNGFEMPAEKRMAMDAAMEVNAAFYGEVLTLREPLGCYRIHASNVTGHLTVSHRRFIRTIDKFDLKLAYLQQRCQVWGIDFDPDAARALLAEPTLGPVQALEVYDPLVAKIEAVLEHRRMLVAVRTLALHHVADQIAKLPIEIRDQLVQPLDLIHIPNAGRLLREH